MVDYHKYSKEELIGILHKKDNIIKVIAKEKSDLETKIEETNIRDSFLPNVYNKGYLFKELYEQILEAERENKPFDILFIDVDGLKQINDTYGHNDGDKLLIETSNFLNEHIRKNEHVYRFGGDEFAIIAKSTNIESFVQRLTEEMVKHNVVLSNGLTVKLNMSIGKATYIPANLKYVLKEDQLENYANELIKNADSDMYINKLLRKTNGYFSP
jgi:diguanylate cyclase (GGDEF)-like protein